LRQEQERMFAPHLHSVPLVQAAATS